MQYCTFCGSERPEHTRFCGYCGHLFSDAEAGATDLTHPSGVDLSTLGASAINNASPNVNSQKQDELSSATTCSLSEGGNVQNSQPAPDPRTDQQQAILLDVPLPGMFPGQGQALPGNVPMVPGTPQVNNVPMVPGTPQVNNVPTVQSSPPTLGTPPSTQGAGSYSNTAPSASPVHHPSPPSPFHRPTGQSPPHNPYGPSAQPHLPAPPGANPPPVHHGPEARANHELLTHTGQKGAIIQRSPQPSHHKPWWKPHALHNHSWIATLLIVGTLAIFIIASGISAALIIFPASLSILSSSSNSVASGEMLQVHGRGFIAGGSVVLTFDDHMALSYQKDGTLAEATNEAVAEKVAALQIQVAEQLYRSIASNGNVSVKSDGTFNATIRVSENWHLGQHRIHAVEGLGWRSAVLEFTITSKPAKLVVAPSVLDFGQIEVGRKVILRAMVQNAGGQPLQWVADTSGTRWLNVLTIEGQLQPGQLQQAISVAADATHLKEGSYFASLRVSSNGGEARAGVRIKVVAQSPKTQAKLNISPNSLDFGSQAAGNQATLQVAISNSGTDKLDWKADTQNIPWLKLDRNTGTIQPGGLPQILYATVNTSNLTTKNYTATIPVTSNGGKTQVKVTLVVLPPQQTSFPSTPPKSIPQPDIVVNPSRLNADSDCSHATGQGWICIVTVSNDRSNQAGLGWLASSSGIGGISFYPATGTLLPDQSQPVTIIIQETHCPAIATFTFKGPGNSVNVPWSCAPPKPVLFVSPLSFSADSDCTYTPDQGWLCPTTLYSENAQSNLNWSASSGGKDVTFNPVYGSFAPGQSEDVNVIVPNISCPGNVTFTFKGPTNTVTVPWNCKPPELDVHPPRLDFGKMDKNNSKTLSVSLGNNGGQQLSWKADTGGTSWLSLDTPSGQVAPHNQQALQVTADTAGLEEGDYPATVFIHSNGGSVRIHITLTVSKIVNPCVFEPLSKGYTFTTQEGSNPDPMAESFTIVNKGCTGGVTMTSTVTLESGTGWLAVTPTSATIAAGESATFTVRITSSDLTASSYAGFIRLNAEQDNKAVENSPQMMGVNLVVIPPAKGEVNPSVFNQSSCPQNSDGSWTCQARVRSRQGNQGNLSWSALSDVSGVTFSPASGSLLPGQSMPVAITIPATACKNGSFSFTFPGNSAQATWNCSQPGDIDASLGDCSYTVGIGWNCAATVYSLPTNQSNVNWSASSSGISGISLSPASGTLPPDHTAQVTLSIPDTVCPAHAGFTFGGPAKKVSLAWNCSTPTLTVSARTEDKTGNCPKNSDGSFTCIDTLSLAPGSQGKLNWSASSDLPGVAFNPSSGTLSPDQSVPVTVTVPPDDCKPGSFAYAGKEANTITVSWSCWVNPPKPRLVVSPTSLATSNCTLMTNIWECVVTLTESADSQGNLNWSASSDLSSSQFSPQSGQLSPGQATNVVLTVACTSGTFTFTGGDTPVTVPWSCSAPSTPTVTPTATPTPTPTSVSTDTPTPTPTAVPTETPTPTPTSAPIDTPTPTPTPISAPTDTPTPTSAPIDTPTPTPTAVPTETPTPTPTSVPTDTPTPTPTEAPPTPTPTPMGTSTTTSLAPLSLLLICLISFYAIANRVGHHKQHRFKDRLLKRRHRKPNQNT